MSNKLLTEKCVEQEYGIPVRTLQSKRLTGDGPVFIKMGRSVRYTSQAIEEYLASRTFRSTSEATIKTPNGAS